MFKFLDEFEDKYNFKPRKPVKSSIEDILKMCESLCEE